MQNLLQMCACCLHKRKHNSIPTGDFNFTFWKAESRNLRNLTSLSSSGHFLEFYSNKEKWDAASEQQSQLEMAPICRSPNGFWVWLKTLRRKGDVRHRIFSAFTKKYSLWFWNTKHSSIRFGKAITDLELNFLKYTRENLVGWRNGSLIESLCFSSTRPTFSSQYPL